LIIDVGKAQPRIWEFVCRLAMLAAAQKEASRPPPYYLEAGVPGFRIELNSALSAASASNTTAELGQRRVPTLSESALSSRQEPSCALPSDIALLHCGYGAFNGRYRPTLEGAVERDSPFAWIG
jgi:hypothetical protein